MSDSQITDLKTYCIFKFQSGGSVNLTVNPGNTGNLTSISDTRLQAGAASTSTTSFPSEGITAEPSTVTPMS